MDLYSTGIRPLVDKYLQDKSEEVRDYGQYWSASSAGYCYRLNIFRRLGIPEVNPQARKQRVFSSGHIFHQWIQGITKEAGLSIAQELELQDEDLMIRGHIDDLVIVDNKLILMDYKTAHSKWFEYAKSRPMSYYHKMQLGTYMYMLRKSTMIPPGTTGSIHYYEVKDFWNQLTEARRLAISKDDLRLHEQQLLWTASLADEVIRYWQGLNEAWAVYKELEELPPCTCAEHEKNSKTGLGFMADEKWNDFFYQGEPCSETWFREQLKVKENK